MSKKLFLLVCSLVCLHFPAFSRSLADSPITRNDLKMTLLSLGSGSARFTYERAFTPRNSAEITVGIVGLGFDIMNNANPKGVLFKMAVKYTLLPQKSAPYTWLAGFYVKPELVVADYDYDHASLPDVPEQTFHTTHFALLAEGGYQLVLWKWFVFDVYAGLGPS